MKVSELSYLEGGKSFRRTRYKARVSIKLSKNSFACVNFYACIPMNRSWRAKNLWELCMSITYDRIFKFFTAIFIEIDRNIVRVVVNCLIRQLSKLLRFWYLDKWIIHWNLAKFNFDEFLFCYLFKKKKKSESTLTLYF